MKEVGATKAQTEKKGRKKKNPVGFVPPNTSWLPFIPTLILLVCLDSLSSRSGQIDRWFTNCWTWQTICYSSIAPHAQDACVLPCGGFTEGCWLWSTFAGSCIWIQTSCHRMQRCTVTQKLGSKKFSDLTFKERYGWEHQYHCDEQVFSPT